MIDDLLAEARTKMDLAYEHFLGELSTVRTGRANPQLLHRIHVNYYGTPTPIQQLAGFSVPEPRLLVVQPYDKSSLGPIAKALQESDLGLNPTNDGNVIRLVFPALTEERRRELVKIVRHMAEEARIAVRAVRRNVKADLESLRGEISDDDVRRGEKELQELTDAFVARIDAALERKEAELLEV